MAYHRPKGRFRVSSGVITTNATGDATKDLGPIFGQIESISVKVTTWTSGAVDLTFTDKTTGFVILTLTNLATGTTRYPVKDLFSTQAGADIVAAATSTNPYDTPVVNGLVTVVVAQGGNTLAGEVYIDVNEGLPIY